MKTKNTTRKLMLSAMFACLAYVLNTFVYFPAMAPFQHFVDVLAAVFVGPWLRQRVFMRSFTYDVWTYHSGNHRSNLWPHHRRSTLSENQKDLPRLCGRNHRHWYLRRTGVLPTDEMVLWPRSSKLVLLHPFLYPRRCGRRSDGRRRPASFKTQRCLSQNAQ